MKNEVEILVDRMIDSLPKGFKPKEIMTSHPLKKKLGKEYNGLKVTASLDCPEHAITIR